jgi:hypothetical protein
MKERPIIFSGPMVLAILEGRKTQTRRVVKSENMDGRGLRWCNGWETWHGRQVKCPYGQPGDRLWAQEAFRYYFDADDLMDCIQYRADNTLRKPDALLSEDEGLRYSDMCDAESPWRSPIHMPRWASRITLEVVSVRVERLQEISREDCIAEGIQHTFKGYEISGLQHEYAALWESINGKGSWDANPWVWVVAFKKMDGAKC